MMHDNHSKLMKLAINEAVKAGQNDEVPIGAVIVAESGEILSLAHNSGGTLFRQIKKVYAILDSLVKSQNLELLRQLVGIVKVVNTHIYCGY